MKKTIFVAIMLMLLLLTGCGETKITLEEGKKAPANHEKTWTVLIYACGDNNGKTSRAIESLTKQKYPENINIVMQTGGSNTWALEGINGEYAQRYLMQKGSIYLKDQKQGTSMGNYETFSAFVNWGMEAYPADNYMLFIIGDGNGIEVCRDELFGGDSLDIEELYYALSMAPDIIDAICFDAPHMASLEMATALPNYAKYMVASEEKFDGFDYKALLDCIVEYPMAQPQEICKELCESYAKNCEENGTGELAQVSVLDLSQVSHLNQVFDALALKLLSNTNTASDTGALIRYLEVAQRCVNSDMVDLGSFANALSEIGGESCTDVTDAIAGVVLCNTKGALRSESSGISICYPESPTVPDSYLKSTISDYYKQFLKDILPEFDEVDGFITEGAKDSSAYQEYTGLEFALEDSISNGVFSGTIVGDISILKRMTAKKYILEDGKYLGSGATEELDCFWAEQRYQMMLEAKVPTIKGVALDTRLVSRDNSVSIYCSDILLDEKNAYLYIAYYPAEDKYTYIGIWTGDGFLKDSDKGEVTLLRTDKSTGKKVAAKTFKASSDIPIKSEKLPSGSYHLEFEAEDIYGKTYTSAGVSFSAQ